MNAVYSQRPWRLCLLGCGWAARLHSRTLRALRGEIRLAYASRDPEKARTYCRRYKGFQAFGSYEEALHSRAIDAIAVLTPPASHLQWSLQALEAGKDVVLEKPPLLHSADFDLLEGACRRSGRRVFIAENYHYKPLATRLRHLLVSSTIGRPLFLHLNALKSQTTGGWRDNPELAGGGALFEGGIHWIRFAANLGLRPRRLCAVRAGSTKGPERSMALLLDYHEGAVALLSYSWEVYSPLKGLRISRIYGTEGSIVFESNGLFVAVCSRRPRLLFPGFRDIQGYRAMFLDFLRAWRTGNEPSMTLALARQDIELIEEAYRSAALSDHREEGD